MPSVIALVRLATVLGVCFSSTASADLNKCVDPKTKKVFFTDEGCAGGQYRRKRFPLRLLQHTHLATTSSTAILKLKSCGWMQQTP